MPSSISSSEDTEARLLEAPWGRTWLVALLVAVSILAALEIGWRAMGHRPSVIDDMPLWAQYRRRATTAPQPKLVVLGASEIQLAFDTDDFRKRFPQYQVIQLAINGKGPVATLADLGKDEQFSATVLCSVIEHCLARRYHDDQQPWIDYYWRTFNANASINRSCATFIQKRLTIVHPFVNLRDVVGGAAFGRPLPHPWYATFTADRVQRGDYTALSADELTRRQLNRADLIAEWEAPPPDLWLEEAMAVVPAVKAIHRRGGRVAFLRMPTDGPIHRAFQRQYPRRQYWDRFAQQIDTVTIYFQDEPTLQGFDCPDGTHIDFRDAPAFTAALCDVLVREGVLNRSATEYKAHR